MGSKQLAIVLLYCAVQHLWVHSQALESSNHWWINAIAEEIYAENPEAGTVDILIEELSNMYDRPIRLNQQNEEDINRLNLLLTDYQLFALKAYMHRYGPLISLNELLLVYGFTEETIQRLKPFALVEPPGNITPAPYRNKTEWLSRASLVPQGKQGFVANSAGQSAYAGDKFKVYNRLKIQQNAFQIGATYEKDAGEKFINSHGRPEFLSAYVQYGPSPKLNLVAGDYRVQLGQGLLLWTGFNMGKSSLTMQQAKSSSAFAPYASSGEALFFRGLAGSVSIKKLSINGFVSFAARDANISEEDSVKSFSSLMNTGLHRTKNELAGYLGVKEPP
ncbi:MAG: general secretion pathway protein GspK [Bacteroidales bacterium]|nr:general secretion pathway protein GspK [Bacteroidales bacterium]